MVVKLLPQEGVDSKLKGLSSFTEWLFSAENKNNPNGSLFSQFYIV